MKKFYTLLFCAGLFAGHAQTNWERSVATESLPDWAGTGNTERGMAYNTTNDHMYVVERNGDNSIRVIDGADGSDLATIDRDASIITGGTFPMSDVEVSSDGSFLVCNLTLDTNGSAFKVYKYDDETATPSVYIDFTTTAPDGPLRLGDDFTVLGDISTDAVIMAAGSGKVVRWVVSGGTLGAPTIITLDDTHGGNMVAQPLSIDATPEFFVNSNAQPIRKYNADGTSAGEVLSIVGGSSNDFKYFEQDSKEYIAVFQFGSGEIGELATLVDVTGGLGTATTVNRTPKLGGNANGNGTGGVGVKTEGTNTITVFTLGTNNGISGTTLVLNGTVLSDKKLSVSETNISPNPATNVFQISMNNAIAENAEVNVFDINGRNVLSSKLRFEQQSISVANLSKGLYIVQINNGGNLFTSKLLKN